MRSTIWKISGLGLIAAGLVACAQEAAMPDRTDGAAFFAGNCASCHGARGLGDGPLAADLSPKPTDLTTLSQANGGSFPAARALSYIYGDPQKAHLARVMPEFGGAMAEDLVPVEIDGILTPTPRALAGLLAYLESIQS
ncbi:MAG: c-type cytochrome [Sulfitobacter sp.]